MKKIIDKNSIAYQISTNEFYRGILLDRLCTYRDSEKDAGEKAILSDLARWLTLVEFAA